MPSASPARMYITASPIAIDDAAHAVLDEATCLWIVEED
jgi:hypothetical protein